jgi:DNA damage-binding protein 1
MVTQVPQEFFEFLTELQTRLSGVIKSVGRIDHESWRSFFNERKTEAMEVKSASHRWNTILQKNGSLG